MLLFMDVERNSQNINGSENCLKRKLLEKPSYPRNAPRPNLYKSSRFQGNESEPPHRKCWTVLTFSVPSQNVDPPVHELLQPGVTLSLYMPVTNPVLAKAVQPRRSLALHFSRYVVTRIILALLIKFSIHSGKQVGTVVQLLSGRHMNRGLTPGKRFLSSKRPHRLWGPPHLLSSGYRAVFLGESGRVVKPQLTSI